MLVYSLLRFGLTAAIAAVLTLFAPFVFALIIAVILQLPLSWLLFARQRTRVNELMAGSRADRRAVFFGDSITCSSVRLIRRSGRAAASIGA